MAYRGLGIEWSGSYSFGGGSGSGTDTSAGAAAGRDAGRAFTGSSGPAFPVLDPNAPGMGPGTFKMTTAKATYTPKPTCMTAKQAAMFLPCFTHKPPAGMTSAQLATLCGQANAAGLVDLPYCPDVKRGKIPDCLDAGWVNTLSYCDSWPQYNGPKPMMNALCWGAKKDAAWYAEAQARPHCDGGASSDAPPGGSSPDVDSASSGSKYMMYAGIGLLGLVVLGAGYAATRKH